MIYLKERLEIYTSAELNKFGERYHDILVETGKGIVEKDRNNEIIKDDRTQEQIDLVNKITTSMLPVLERIAFSLTNVGHYGNYPFNLRGISVERVRTPIADAVNEGARYVINHFHTYKPDRTNKEGSVYSFVVLQAGVGMTMHILKNIPNSAAIFNQIKRRTSKGLSEEEIFENLPYVYPISLTDILDGDENTGRNVDLERDYLTSDSNPEEEVISKITGERISKVVEDLLSTLNSREREILERRKGLNGYEKMTLDKVGEIFKISRERVNQIQKKAEDKLREYPSEGLVELVR